MVQFFSKRRLKIAEQIIIVIFFAVLIPMTVSGIIINNIADVAPTLNTKAFPNITKIVSLFEKITVIAIVITNQVTTDDKSKPVTSQKLSG